MATETLDVADRAWEESECRLMGNTVRLVYSDSSA